MREIGRLYTPLISQGLHKFKDSFNLADKDERMRGELKLKWVLHLNYPCGLWLVEPERLCECLGPACWGPGGLGLERVEGFCGESQESHPGWVQQGSSHSVQESRLSLSITPPSLQDCSNPRESSVTPGLNKQRCPPSCLHFYMPQWIRQRKLTELHREQELKVSFLHPKGQSLDMFAVGYSCWNNPQQL